MKIIYFDAEGEDKSIHEMEVDSLNGFCGANIPYMQVLKSAAGYYIGQLCEADWSPESFWEPYLRDSACYWEKRKDAEQALKTRNYPVSF